MATPPPGSNRADNWKHNIALTAAELARAGSSVLELLEAADLWVNRRVDTIRFVDEHLARHQLSVDIRLPMDVEPVLEPLGGQAVSFVPLTVLRRRADLVRFDLKDEKGHDVPLINRFVSARVSTMALKVAAERILERDISDHLLRLFAGAATDSPRSLADPSIVRALIDPRSMEWFGPAVRDSLADRRLLASDERFCNLVSLFAIGSIVLVPLADSLGRRRIIKIGWDEPLSAGGEIDISDRPKRRPQALRRRLSAAFGFSDTLASLDMSLVGGAEAHHVQIEAPPEVELSSAELKAFSPRDRLNPGMIDRPISAPIPTYVKRETGPTRRAHIYLDNTPQIGMGSLRTELRGSHGGFLRGALAAAFLITAMLWLFFLRADSIAGQTTSASILLLAPGLLAAYIVRPGEHLLARKLRRPWRWLLTFDGILALLAAAAFVAFSPGSNVKDPDAPEVLSLVWLLCAILASAILAILVASWRRSRVAA